MDTRGANNANVQLFFVSRIFMPYKYNKSQNTE